MKDFKPTYRYKRTDWEMRFYLIAFILGMIVYLYIPKDVTVTNPATEPMDQVTFMQSEANGCITYQEIHAVGKDLMPVERTVCK